MNILLRPAIPYIVHIMGGAESSGTGTQETADPVKDLATRYNGRCRQITGIWCKCVFIVSEREVAYLRRRFQALNPDEAGLIDRSVFQHPPYSTDPFCRQVHPRRCLLTLSLKFLLRRYGSAFLAQKICLTRSRFTNTPNQ